MLMKRVLANGVRLFLIDDVPPEDMAMLMALYARSGESVEAQVEKVYEARRKALREAIIAVLPYPATGANPDFAVSAAMQVVGNNHPTTRAARLNERYVAGYGHKSIADNGSTALFVEGGSMLLAKALEDTPLFNGQEMSTRAVDCAKQPFVDPVGSYESEAILSAWRNFYIYALRRAPEEIRRKYPRAEGEDEVTYDRAVSMRAFDVCRGFLPFGCATQVGWAGSLRHVGDRLGVLNEHPSLEVRDVAEGFLAMCRERYPSSGFGDVSVSGTGKLNESDESREARRKWTAEMTRYATYVPERYNSPGDVMHSHIAFKHPGKVAAGLLASRPRGALLPHSFGSLGLAHFDFLLDMGSWRDVQRHRALVCEPALLIADHGFEPWYLNQLPLDLHGESETFVENQVRRVRSLTDDPVLRQYYLGMGLRVRTRISASLPALVYMLELRSGKTIHPTLRRRVLEMADHFQEAHPEIALHINRDPDDWSVRRGTHVITDKGSV